MFNENPPAGGYFTSQQFILSNYTLDPSSAGFACLCC